MNKVEYCFIITDTRRGEGVWGGVGVAWLRTENKKKTSFKPNKKPKKVSLEFRGCGEYQKKKKMSSPLSH